MSFDYSKLPHSGIRALHPYVPGKSIESLAKEKQLTHIIKLASNENQLGCSPLAQAALGNISADHLASYPAPHQHPIYTRLAQKLGVSTNQLALANGSDTIFPLLMTLFCLNNGKKMMTHELSFQTYRIQAQILGVPTIVTPLDEHFEVDIDKLISTCSHNTGIIFFANPNNPTGISIPMHRIKRLLDHVPESTIVVIDEAYYEYTCPKNDLSTLDLLGNYPNLVITRTFSKAYGLAALRLGYAISNPLIIEMLLKIQPPFAVNFAALEAANAALDDDQFIDKTLSMNEHGMKQVHDGLQKLGFNPLPSKCNFLTFDCQTDANKIYESLLDRGIIIRPLAPYGFINGLRVTIGTHKQNQLFLEALAAVI